MKKEQGNVEFTRDWEKHCKKKKCLYATNISIISNISAYIYILWDNNPSDVLNVVPVIILFC